MNKQMTPLQVETFQLFDTAGAAYKKLSPPLWGTHHEKKSYRIICDELPEEELIESLIALDLDYRLLDGKSYASRVFETFNHFIARGLYPNFIDTVRVQKPQLDWPAPIPADQSRHFSKSELNKLSLPVQYCNLLNVHFASREEREPIINALRLTISNEYGYRLNRMQLCACIVIYAQYTGQSKVLLDTMKEQRPNVEAIQQLPYQLEDSKSTAAIDIYTLIETFSGLVEYETVPPEYEPLASELEQRFSMFNLEEMIADLGWRSSEYILEDKPSTIRLLILNVAPNDIPAFTKLLSWCQIRQPEIDWFALANVDRFLILQSEVLFKDGAKSIAIRNLMNAIWQDNDNLFEFCKAYFPASRRELSLVNAPQENYFYFLGYIERRGYLENLLILMEREYAEEYGKFGPYI